MKANVSTGSDYRKVRLGGRLDGAFWWTTPPQLWGLEKDSKTAPGLRGTVMLAIGPRKKPGSALK